MVKEDLPTLYEGECYYTTDLKGRLCVEEALLDTGEVVIAAPWGNPRNVIDVINGGETYLGKGRTHR